MILTVASRHSVTTLGLTLGAAIATFLVGCSTTPLPPMPRAPTATRALPPMVVTPTAVPTDVERLVSQARTPQDYRVDAANHLYSKNQHRLYHGKMPPQLYAVGVLQVEVNNQGRVTSTSWMRAPKHAPEVMAEIERTVRQAEPYPAPIRMGRVTYTDTWLWHKSGLFQLDTLSEGQM